MRRRQGLCVLSWCRGIYRGGVTGSLFLAQQLNGDNFPAWGRSRLLKVHPCSGGPVLRRHGNWPTVEPNCPVREAVHYAGLSYGFSRMRKNIELLPCVLAYFCRAIISASTLP